jgi:1-deoxy-D-xylulose-5-phosphate reductoisomerase
MRHAIGYALHWPERRQLPVGRLDLAETACLDFRRPDPERYPALELAHRVMEMGGLAGAAFNAAKEAALDLFIARAIRFTEMAPIVARVLDRMQPRLEAGNMTLDMVAETDRAARDHVRDLSK